MSRHVCLSGLALGLLYLASGSLILLNDFVGDRIHDRVLRIGDPDTIARLTLLPKSRVSSEASAAAYFDVTGNSTPDSTPVGSINRARQPAEVASREARIRVDGNVPSTLPSNNAPSETLAQARENAHG